jgi:hypothetical protein
MQHKFNEGIAAQADDIKKMWMNKFSLSYYNLANMANMLKTHSYFSNYMKNKASFQKSTRLNPILIQINSAHDTYTCIIVSSLNSLGLPSAFFASGSQQEFFFRFSHLSMRATCRPIMFSLDCPLQ